MPAADERAPATLHAQQAAFAAHLRDPDGAPPPPGLEARRLQVYRELFLDGLLGLLAGNFPVIRRILGADGWRTLVRDFYREHRCTTPLFPEVPREFVQYLARRAGDGRGDPGWLPELAHYEWVELALDISEADPADVPHDPDGDLLDGVPVASPLAWALAYAWPVHRLSPTYLPDAPGAPTFLLVHRDAGGRVRFDAIDALTFRLLQRLDEHAGLRGREQLAALAVEAGTADVDAFVADGHAMLRRLHAQGIVPGTVPRRARHPDSP
jgi:uncharacterized protein